MPTSFVNTERASIKVSVKPSTSSSPITNNRPSIMPASTIKNPAQKENEIVSSPEPSLSLSLSSGHYSMQGIRNEMEDKVVLLNHPAFNEIGDINDSVSRSFFAVFDGHGGDVSAEYCRQHVHLNFISDSSFITDSHSALKSALIRTDSEFCSACKRINLVSSSGTTAICAFVNENKLIVANIGDSRGVLIKKSNVNVIPVSNDHKPGRVDERERIEKCGGRVGITEEEAYSGRIPSCIFFTSCFPSSRPLRVFPGGLSVSRTIGDIGMKNGGLIIAEPEMFSSVLTSDDLYLILACDGVWDVMSNLSVAELCKKNLQQNDMEEMAKIIAKEAFRRGSTDNISVVAVKLIWTNKEEEKKEKRTS